ncbi:hypothetical protein [Pyrobaculum ferrireducens]|uniref:Uncharacterized protein n=1 Tax=Pyrobaculum ferrireducens TaxID=1104324 RepID=G7VGX8_9CREN|nr:hypothetical protein [Pyrobaculum ferrireducens]AET31961.1 hypothetical protein P186_0509 [Pyrobaculum ferrireducens]
MPRGALILLVAVALASAQSVVLVVNGTIPFKAVAKDSVLSINGSEVALPQKRLSWYFNGTYTVFGIDYSNPQCQLGTWPNQPKFYVACSTGSDFTVVAVKDPKARAVCYVGGGSRKDVLKPAAATPTVEIYQTKGLYIECEAGYPAVASAPSTLLGILAGITSASATLLLVMSVLLLRSLFKKEH